jgi:hypothetical protein
VEGGDWKLLKRVLFDVEIALHLFSSNSQFRIEERSPYISYYQTRRTISDIKETSHTKVMKLKKLWR